MPRTKKINERTRAAQHLPLNTILKRIKAGQMVKSLYDKNYNIVHGFKYLTAEPYDVPFAAWRYWELQVTKIPDEITGVLTPYRGKCVEIITQKSVNSKCNFYIRIKTT